MTGFVGLLLSYRKQQCPNMKIKESAVGAFRRLRKVDVEKVTWEEPLRIFGE